MDPAYADEKLVVQHIDEVARLEASIDPALESKLLWKLDCFILPLGMPFYMYPTSPTVTTNPCRLRKGAERSKFALLTFRSI